jgi:hypothetical protein
MAQQQCKSNDRDDRGQQFRCVTDEEVAPKETEGPNGAKNEFRYPKEPGARQHDAHRKFDGVLRHL